MADDGKPSDNEGDAFRALRDWVNDPIRVMKDLVDALGSTFDNRQRLRILTPRWRLAVLILVVTTFGGSVVEAQEENRDNDSGSNMEVLSHIDIVGDDRIQAILDDSANFNLRAIRAETLLDWMPDLGQYAAPAICRSQNGVFRSPGLARSGLPGILRHRFWIEEEAARVVGKKYVGLLLYDHVGDNYTFELSTGSVEIGALRPWRHDNRRHLIVTPEPVEILSGHIPFTVRAIGKGMCYVESLVFMSERPAASSFAPEIERLTARIIDRKNERLTANVHFITQEASTTQVEAVPEGGADDAVVLGRGEQLDRLHVVTLSNLKADTRYKVNVLATERGGATAQASLDLETDSTSNIETVGAPVAIPLEILRLGKNDPVGLPLTFGAPIAEGQLTTPLGGVLHCQGQQFPAQTRVHARWPDGSARWVLVDVSCPPELANRQQVEAELRLSSQADREIRGLSWQADADRICVEGERLRVCISEHGPLPARIERRTATGDWRPAFDEASTFMGARLGNGVELTNGPIEGLTLEEAGAERAVIRYELPLVDDRGIVHFRSTIRLHVYARLPFVRLVHRTVVTSPVLGAAYSSDSLDHLTAALKHVEAAVVGTEGEATSLLDVESLELTLPWLGKGDDAQRRVVHEHDRSYQVESDGEVRHHEGHWPGVFFLTSAETNLAVAVKDFWQAYPKGIRNDESGVVVELLPKLSGTAPPDYDELWHKLYFWYDRESARYKLKIGMALTTEMLIGFPEQQANAEAWQEWLERPTVVRPEISYLNGTKALLPLGAKEDSPHPGYEALMDGAFERWVRHRDDRHEYGFASFGDTYSDVELFWSNSEYDSALCLYMEFLRGGDPRLYLLANQATRHLVDIDTCNYSRQRDQIGAQYTHMPGHAGGFLPPYFRSKMFGSATAPSHTWVEGPVLHYLLTGEETVRSVVRRTGIRMTRNLRDYNFGNARECGWQLIHLCGVARMDDDPRFLNAAAIIVEKVLSKQSPGGGWDHPLSEAHCHCEPPRCHGEAGFMVGVLLTGLRRYHELTDDLRAADAIVGGAHWLLDKTYVPEAKQFRYTSCPNRAGPSAGMTMLVVEGLADAYKLDQGPRLGDVLRDSLVHLGSSGEASQGGPRYGRSLSIEARYIPTMLHTLKTFDISTQE